MSSRRNLLTGGILALICLIGIQVACGEDPGVLPPGVELEGDPLDLEELVSTNKHPAEDIYWEAIRYLEDPVTPDLELGCKLLEEAAERGSTPAQNMFAIACLTGQYGIRKSNRRAAEWFRMAAEDGDAYAMLNLARCYLTGTGVWKSRPKATPWLLKVMDPQARFPQLDPPEWYHERMRLTVAVEEPVFLFDLKAEEDGIYLTRLDAAALLAEIYREDGEQEKAHQYAYFASGIEKRSTSGYYNCARQAALNFAFGQGTHKDRRKATELLDFSKQLAHKRATRYAHSLNQAKLLDTLALDDFDREVRDYADKAVTGLEFEIASILSNRESDDWDVSEAIPWYELAADSGHAWAMLKLAFIYHDTASPVHDPSKAFEWFEKASLTGRHALGTYNLGTCYLLGLGTARDPDRARETYARGMKVSYACYAAFNGNPPGRILSYEEALDLHEQATKGREPDPEALYLYGKRLRKGTGVVVDFDKAYTFFSKAAKKGHADATYAMGEDYYYGYSHTKDLEKAYKLFLQADELGSREAPFRLGYMTSSGYGCRQDKQAAEAYYSRAIAIYPESRGSLNNLADLYEQRLLHLCKVTQAEVDSNPDAYSLTPEQAGDPERLPEVLLAKFAAAKGTAAEEAMAMRSRMLEYYEKAAHLGSDIAAYNLALLYQEGVLVPEDQRKAYLYFRDAAEGGNTNAHYQLGLMHDQGIGLERTPREAAYHYRLAAIGESTKRHMRIQAYDRLVFFYRYGVGVPRDLERALHWAYRLAGTGSVLGWKQVGDLLIDLGRFDTALEYFRQVERRDFNKYLKAHALARLSEMHGNGWGVRQDSKKASKYFRDAIEAQSAYAYFISGQQLITEQQFENAAAAFVMAAMTSSQADDRKETCSINLGGQTVLIEAGLAAELPDALYQLGCLVYAGKGLPADREKAWTLFRMAAELGSSPAQFNIAVAVLNNNPLAPPIEDAVEWLQMAVNAGYPQAEKVMQKLQDRMYAQRKSKGSKLPDGERGTSSSWWMEST